MKAPTACPICGTQLLMGWGPTSSYKESLSAGKAAIGGLAFGPVGAIVGASMGKNKHVYTCTKCGYSQTYSG